MPPRKGTKRKAEPKGSEAEEEVDVSLTATTTSTTTSSSSKKTASATKAKSEKVVDKSASRGRGRPRKVSKTIDEKEKEEIPTESGGEEVQFVEKIEPSKNVMEISNEPSSSSSSSSVLFSSLSSTTVPSAFVSTDESGIGLLKRILYSIPNPSPETIGATIGKFRLEMAKRFSVEPTKIRIFDPRTDLPGTELTEDSLSITDFMNTELRVFITETNGAVKEWIVWVDQEGNNRKGITPLAHQTMESLSLANYISKPSLLDMKRTEVTGIPTATIPVAESTLVVAYGGPDPKIEVVELRGDTSTKTIPTLFGNTSGQTPPGGGTIEAENRRSHPTRTHLHPLTETDAHNTRSHDKNKVEPGFIAHDVVNYHQHPSVEKNTTISSSGTAHHTRRT